MNRSQHKHMISPIIGRCVILNQNVLKCTLQTKNCIKHPYVDELKKDASLLFKYALRQLNGKDYYKRTIEIIEEIQSHTYLLLSLDGITRKDAVKIDVDCDEILEMLNRIKFGQDVKSNG